MNAITLRNLSPELTRVIRSRAKTSGASINKTVIAVLEESLLGKAAKPRCRYRDLDHLAGSWTREQADEFDRYLAEERQIDWELWK
jgi:plasmid stability protein